MEIDITPYFRNIGNGIAFNIKIRDGHFKIKDRHIIDGDRFSQYAEAYEFQYNRVVHILQNNCILQIDVKYCDIISIGENFSLPSDKFAVLDAKNSITSYRTIIEFQNIDMQWYYVEQETSFEGIEIINSGPLRPTS